MDAVGHDSAAVLRWGRLNSVLESGMHNALDEALAAAESSDLSAYRKLAVKFHALFPGFTADLLGLVNRLLPEPGGIGTQRAKGEDSGSKLSPSFLTTLSERAAVRNNQTS